MLNLMLEKPCLLHDGPPTKGYAYIHDENGKRIGVHIKAFKDAGGIILKGHIVHHKCENKRCREPTHLEAMSTIKHGKLHRGLDKDGVCKRGHDMKVFGVWRKEKINGRFRCKECKRLDTQRQRLLPRL